jgi:energy-converting hydrogenase Eha subunit A
LEPVPERIKYVLALLLALIVAAMLVSPAVNIAPTTVHAWNAARHLATPMCAIVGTSLAGAVTKTQVLLLAITTPIAPGAADLTALNCTRLC